MDRTISWKALKWDLNYFWSSYSHFVRHFWLFGGILLVMFVFGEFSDIGFGFLLIGTFLHRFYKYTILKRKEKSNEVLLLKKSASNRKKNLYAFLAFIFLAWLFRDNIYPLMFFLMMSVHWLTRYIFYIPSIIFTAKDYYLNICKGFRQKRIDFSYQNRLRFVYNRIAFDHPVNGKIVFKNIQLDASNIQQVAKFLDENFGKEMVNCPQLNNINTNTP